MTASSVYSSGFPASSAIDGDRRGIGWGAGSGGWADATPGQYPDWLAVAFAGAQSIGEIDLFTIQDQYATLDPTHGNASAFAQAFAAGALLTMVSDTMLPEAFQVEGTSTGWLPTRIEGA